MAAMNVAPVTLDPTAGASSTPPSALDRAAPGTSFAEMLGNAVAGVDALQADADRASQQVALGSGNLHETALALEKADVALKVAMKVRNKLVEAYQDIMKMSV